MKMCFISILVCFQALLYHHIQAKEKWTDKYNLTEIETLANATYGGLDVKITLLLNCSRVFSISESLQDLKICSIEESTDTDVRRKREIFHPQAFEMDARDVVESESYENTDDADDYKERVIRGVIVTNSKLKRLLPWKWLESNFIRGHPCIGSCILEEMGLYNETMDAPDRSNILKLLTERVTNITNDTAESIADSCLKNYQKRIAPSTAATDSLKCAAVVKLGVCLSKEAFEFCKKDSGAASTVGKSK